MTHPVQSNLYPGVPGGGPHRCPVKLHRGTFLSVGYSGRMWGRISKLWQSVKNYHLVKHDRLPMTDYLSDVPPKEGNHVLSKNVEQTTLASFRSSYKFNSKPARGNKVLDYQKNKYGQVSTHAC